MTERGRTRTQISLGRLTGGTISHARPNPEQVLSRECCLAPGAPQTVPNKTPRKAPRYKRGAIPGWSGHHFSSVNDFWIPYPGIRQRIFRDPQTLPGACASSTGASGVKFYCLKRPMSEASFIPQGRRMGRGGGIVERPQRANRDQICILKGMV